MSAEAIYGRDWPEPVDPGPVDNPARESDLERHHRGQARMAYRLADAYGDHLMHVHGIGWHAWDGRRWAEDDRGAATRAVLDVLRDALAASLGDSDLRADVRKCESAAGVAGVLDLASALETFAVTVGDLDADPYLLNCANGTLDLRTMQLRPHDPVDRITKVTRGGYDPAATSLEWEGFLVRVLPGEDVRGYLQRLVGLSLLGRVAEHILAIATGTGANGKGTAYGAVLYALGDYGHVAESDLFMSARANPNAASPAQMGLRGKRLVVVSETEREHRLAAALMKNLTGGDPITARGLHRSPVTFQPSHTSLMVTNYLPKVTGDDPAIWRRIRVIPFDVVIPPQERDNKLGERLELATDAVLSWAVAGYAEYQRRGMDAPPAVVAATEDYHADADALARFLGDCCIVNPHMHVVVSELWGRWCSWRADDGAEEVSQKAFGQYLETRGFRKDKFRGARIRRGIGLLLADDAEGDGRAGDAW